MGTAFVELRDAEGNPIPGFSPVGGEEIGGGFIDRRVDWKGNPRCRVVGRPVRIFSNLNRAKLYAFQFTAEE